MQNSDYFYKLKYKCEIYKDILEYAKEAEWPLEKGLRENRRHIPFPQWVLNNDSFIKSCSSVVDRRSIGFAMRQRTLYSRCGITRTDARTMFREHTDVDKECVLHLCLHHDHSHTFMLPLDDIVINKDLALPFVEPDYEPGCFYLLNVAKVHGFLNCSDEPRYNGFFTLDNRLTYEEIKRYFKNTTS